MKGSICRISFILTVLICLLGFATLALASEFTADVVDSNNGKEKSRIFVKGSKRRTETDLRNGEKIIIISDSETGSVYHLRSEQKICTETSREQAFSAMDILFGGKLEELNKASEKKDLGIETINGYVCDKYEIINHVTKERTIEWCSKKLGYSIKTIYNSPHGEVSITELKNIKEGPIDDSLFEVPEDYKKISMPTVDPGMGMEIDVSTEQP
ncbi:MAG: DUF4412 domain-containing protein [Candidatus Omnitrophota bacterium]